MLIKRRRKYCISVKQIIGNTIVLFPMKLELKGNTEVEKCFINNSPSQWFDRIHSTFPALVNGVSFSYIDQCVALYIYCLSNIQYTMQT